jgi:hypothetical protein
MLIKTDDIEVYVNLKTTCNLETRCLEFTGHLDRDGYAQDTALCRRLHGTDRVHRAVWLHYNGDIPRGLLVCHACGNRKCVNIDHLWLGTCKDNTRDMITKGREIYVRGSDVNGAKLNPEQGIYIRSMRGKKSALLLAKEFEVSHSNIYI